MAAENGQGSEELDRPRPSPTAVPPPIMDRLRPTITGVWMCCVMR